MTRLYELDPFARLELIQSANANLPDFVLDDDWPDAMDKLAHDLSFELPEYNDLIDDMEIISDLMVETYSSR